MLYHALSLLPSSCASHFRVAAAGEVAKIREGRVSFHFITCGNIQLYCYKLYPIVPLFVATFRMHADDGNNPLFPYPLDTANSLVNFVGIYR